MALASRLESSPRCQVSAVANRRPGLEQPGGIRCFGRMRFDGLHVATLFIWEMTPEENNQRIKNNSVCYRRKKTVGVNSLLHKDLRH